MFAPLWAAVGLAPMPAPGQSRADPDSLEEVVVLAQKRPGPLQDAPLSLSALGAEAIATQGIRDIGDLARRSPTLDLQESVTAVTSTLRIRGVGNLGNIPTFEPAVGLFVDGAYRSRSLFAGDGLLDAERIEVLRGPQTSLYAKNVGAGVVAVYTREPGGSPGARAEVSGGLLDAPGNPLSAAASGVIEGRLAGVARGSLAIGGAWHDRALENALAGVPDGDEMARLGARAQLAWRVGDGLAMRLIGAYFTRAGDEGESDVAFVTGARSTQLLETLQAQGVAQPCPDGRAHNRVTCSVAANHLDLDAGTVTLLADYGLPNGWSLHSLTGYERYRDRRDEDDAVQMRVPLLFFHDSEEGTAWQQELRLASADGAGIPWLAGIFYYDSRYARGSGGRRPMFGANGDFASDPFWASVLGLPLALPGQLGLHDSTLTTDYLGAFGQVTVPMGSRFDVTAGARLSRDRKRASIENSVTVDGASVISRLLTPETSPSGAPVNGELSRRGDDVSWSLTPRFRASGDLMLYATLARGGKAGGFNTGFGNAPLADREFADETIDHAEAGARARFAGGRGRVAASAYRTRFHDYQDAAFISSQFTVGNAGRLDLDGGELEAEYILVGGTHVSFALSYADLRYGQNDTGMCFPGRPPDGGLPGACDLSGERPVDAPPWSLHLALDQPLRLVGADARVRLDWNWTDAYNTSFSADPRLVQGAYHDVALRLSVQLGDSVEVEVAGENLLDEPVAWFDSVLNFFNDASYQSFLAEPRRFGVTLRARY